MDSPTQASDLLLRGGLIKMASGIEMMLKSMGFDPAKIVADFEQLKNGVVTTLQEISERLGRIETHIHDRLDRIETQQEELCQKLSKLQPQPNQPPVVQPGPAQPPVTQPEPAQPQLMQPQPQPPQLSE